MGASVEVASEVNWQNRWIDTCVSLYKTRCEADGVEPNAEHFLGFYALFPYGTKTPFGKVWARFRTVWLGEV